MTFIQIGDCRLIHGDVLESLATLPAGSVQCCVTSPPYWGLRDYGVEGQIGLEPTPEAFIAKMVAVFAEVRRVLRDDGTLWLNLGDSYNGIGGPGKQNGGPIGPTAAIAIESTKGRRVTGLKPKDLCMMPWRVALALQADGWWIRSVICWHKKSPMPESVTDRPTSSWEPIFLMAKASSYFYDAEAVKEKGTTEPHAPGYVNGDKYAVGPMDRGGHSQREQPDRVWGASGRNQRNVWTLASEPFPGSHFATFPTEIPRRAIKAGTSEKGCCPTCGAPWQRVVEREQLKRERPNEYTKRGPNKQDGVGKRTYTGFNERYKAAQENSCANTVAGVSTRTVGWERTCEHDGEPVPCVVLDPFLGSGTSVAVAVELGRVGVGIELNGDYLKLACKRIEDAYEPRANPLFGEHPPKAVQLELGDSHG